MGRVDDALQRASGGGDEGGRSEPAPENQSGQADPFSVSEGPSGSHRAWSPRSRRAEPPAPAVAPLWTTARSTAGGSPPPRDELQLKDIVRTLVKRSRLVIAVVVLSIGAALAYNYTATPFYEAQARLVIELTAPDVVSFRPVVNQDRTNTEYYETQVGVLRSRGIAQRTLQRLGLWRTDASRDAQVDDLLSSLEIAPMERGRLVDVRFRSTDPQLAARVANGIADSYVEQDREAKLQASRQASKWLSDRLVELREQVNESQAALQQYRRKTDLSLGDNQQNIVVQKLAQLNTAVTAARAERIERETLYAQLKAIQQSGSALDTFPPILANAFIQGLKAELAELLRQRGQLSERYGDLHPEMIRINTAIETAQGRLGAETAKVVDSIRNQYEAAAANERGLVQVLEEQKQAVLNLNQAAIGYGELQRDATSTQQVFESVLQRVRESQVAGELQYSAARIVDRATPPTDPVWPRRQLNLMIALFGGFILAVGFVFSIEHLRTRIDGADDVRALGLPILGMTPWVGSAPKVLLSPHGNPPAAFQEALRAIRANILFSPAAADMRTLAVTSAGVGEGKTSVVTNLAVAMAVAGRQVLLIDGDLRRPRVHSVFSLPKSPGLSEVMAGQVRPSEAVRQTTTPGLSVLPSGVVGESPADLLESELFRALLFELGERFDMVVIDSPPVMAVADASLIANVASSVIFVVRANKTSREAAQKALERLRMSHADILGVVLNDARPGRESGYQYDAYYYEPEKGERSAAS